MSLCPTKKRCYLGPESASRMVDVMRRNDRLCVSKKDKGLLHVYKCKQCTFYYVGRSWEEFKESGNLYVDVSKGA